jgi:hypothetical protein
MASGRSQRKLARLGLVEVMIFSVLQPIAGSRIQYVSRCPRVFRHHGSFTILVLSLDITANYCMRI